MLLSSDVFLRLLQALTTHVCDCPVFPSLTMRVLEMATPLMDAGTPLANTILQVLQRVETLDKRIPHYDQLARRSKILIERHLFPVGLYNSD